MLLSSTFYPINVVRSSSANRSERPPSPDAHEFSSTDGPKLLKAKEPSEEGIGGVMRKKESPREPRGRAAALRAAHIAGKSYLDLLRDTLRSGNENQPHSFLNDLNKGRVGVPKSGVASNF